MNATSGNTITRMTVRWAMSNCEMCGGRGVIRVADVYTNLPKRESVVVWELSKIVACGCRYNKEAA